MKVNELMTLLREHSGKELLFEYAENQFAGTNYHLTEVKNVTFETVDCGGKVNDWKETHIQLWESPTEIGKKDYITTDKAVAILDRVNGIRPLWNETEVKIEFGNKDFHTAVLSIDSVNSDTRSVTIRLFTNETGCKALEACGVLVSDEQESNLEEEACCSPQSGCC